MKYQLALSRSGKTMMRFVFAALLAFGVAVPAYAQIGPLPPGTGSGMLATGTYAITGKFSQPHCPLVASAGTFTPTLAAASCPASSADSVTHFDIPLASGANTIAFPTNGSAGQTFRMHLTGPASGTPTLTTAPGYIFPLAGLSSGTVPVSGPNALDTLTCTLVPSSAVPNSSSFAQGGLVASCDIANNYVQPTGPTPTISATGAYTDCAPGATCSTGSIALTLGDKLLVAVGGDSAATAPTITGSGTISGCAQMVATSISGINVSFWLCNITASGTATAVVAHYSPVNTSYGDAIAWDVTNVAGDRGNSSSAPGTGPTASVTTAAGSNGQPTANTLIFSKAELNGSPTPAPTASWLVDENESGIIVQHFLTTTSGAVTASNVFSGGSSVPWVSIIVALQ